jgi:uncharacterized protein
MTQNLSKGLISKIDVVFLLLMCFSIPMFSLSQVNYENENNLKNIGNYDAIEIKATVDENVALYGTLIAPKTRYKIVLVIISGTGKSSQKAHNYLTEFLLENNIAVFRFDKRGVGKSTGKYNDSPSIYTKDFIEIYKELIKLKPISGKKIGFIGHSLGGLVSIKAVENDIKPDFLIQWSTPVGKARELLKYQIKNVIKNYDDLIVGKTIKQRLAILDYANNLIDKHPDKTAWDIWKIAKKECKDHNISKRSFTNYIMPYNVEFARIDNSESYKNLDIPTLFIIGSDDILVDPLKSKNDLLLFGNQNIEYVLINGYNHFMVKKETSEKTNDIYDVAFEFKQKLVNWILDIDKKSIN